MNSKKTQRARRVVAVSSIAGAMCAHGCSAPVGSESEIRTEARSEKLACTASAPLALGPDTRFFVPPPDPAAVQQLATLFKQGDVKDGVDLLEMIGKGHASWFTSGTPLEVRANVAKTVREAALERSVPVLVSYDVPFRDCAGLSAGGAADTASYEAWIDGFAAGIGKAPAVVILEPDSLGIIPYNTTIFGATEGCKPTVTDAQGNVTAAPGADPADRYAQLAYALVRLANAAPNARVYVDGTHSAWLGVGEAAFRINHLTTIAGQTAQTMGLAFDPQAIGFFIDVSNFQPTDQLIQFGTWVSDCITAATAGAPWAAGHFDFCAGQYDPALNFAIDYSAAYEATVTASLENMMAGATATTRFVIDTSRNGHGTLDTSPFAAPPFNQPPNVIATLASGDWCNPPGAGLGLRPTANTGVPLVDAYLWVKVPGESDGTCDIASGARAWDFSQYNPWGVTGDAQNQFDPLWGMVDPVAGDWFPAQALQLAQSL
jgi:endoglucanase